MKKIIHGLCTDIWAAGVTLYMMATGHHPFDSQHLNEFKTLLLETEPDYSVFTSKEDTLFVELMKRMLCKDPTKRATVTELLDNDWVTRSKKNPIYLFNVDEAESSGYFGSELDAISEGQSDNSDDA